MRYSLNVYCDFFSRKECMLLIHIVLASKFILCANYNLKAKELCIQFLTEMKTVYSFLHHPNLSKTENV